MGEFRLAAAVVLVRPRQPRGDSEILLVRRSNKLRFLGGYDVFPGGRLDDGDGDSPCDASFADAALRGTALRELFEETGVLAAHGSERLDRDALLTLRRGVLSHPHDWAASLRALGLSLFASQLTPLGRWLTPAYSSVRYDAHYYALELPAGAEASIWEGELTECRWATASDALARHRAGELALSYPTLLTLRALDEHGLDLARTEQALAHEGAGGEPRAFGEMAHGVWLVPGRSDTLPPATHTNTYVLGGEELVVVDPGTPFADEQQTLIAFLEARLAEGRRLREIWLTHDHVDHVGAIAALQRRFAVPLATHARARPPAGVRAARHIVDNEETTLALGDGLVARWRALYTPGHSPDHLCFYEPTRRLLLSGDLVLGTGTVIIAPPGGHMQTYLDSLTRILALPMRFIFAGHGPPVAATQQRVRAYLEHRAEREHAIVTALTKRPAGATPEDLVPEVYIDVPAAVRRFAASNVLAHLEKLCDDGQVNLRDGRFRLRG